MKELNKINCHNLANFLDSENFQHKVDFENHACFVYNQKKSIQDNIIYVFNRSEILNGILYN